MPDLERKDAEIEELREQLASCENQLSEANRESYNLQRALEEA